MENVNSVTRKVLLIVGLALVLIVPLAQVRNQIADRREYESLAQKEVARGWGGDVKFSSPQVATPGKTIHPTTSEITIEVDSREKKRGVFHVPVYVATLTTTVTFNRPPAPNDEPPKGQHAPEPAYLTLLVKPTSSIQRFKIQELVSGKELKAKLVENGIPANTGAERAQHTSLDRHSVVLTARYRVHRSERSTKPAPRPQLPA